MKKNFRAAICSTVSVLTLSMVVSSAVSAASVADNNKCGGKNVAVANVDSELLIRKSASGSGEVIGYVPSAAGVIVESMNEEWTKVRSGNISGYVKTDYLAFGEKADELKSVYGVLGAVASWNDVKVFADYEDTSSIIGSIDEGEGFEVLGSTDNWVEIRLSNGQKAYVAAEDVDMTLVLDTAVSTDDSQALVQGASSEQAAPASDTADSTPVYTENTYVPETGYVAETEYVPEQEYTDGYIAETEAVYETGYIPETEYTAETEAVYETDYIPETEYTAETEAAYETEYVAETEYVPETEYTEYVEETDTVDENDGLTGDEYIDPETEVQDTTEASGGSETSASDVDLLAALIYCEAGNQSQEGKIAVGQVVMNRVASGSFPNTIHDVIYESGQFTPASSGWLDQVIGSAPGDCYDAAVAAMNGEGSVAGCLYFNAGSGKGIQIGDHQFY